MKAFLVLVVLSAAGLAGVLYWRRTIQAPRAAVVAPAGEPAKDRQGAPAPAAAWGAAPGAQRGLRGVGAAGRSARRRRRDPQPSPPPPEERNPVAPGGASTTEAPPSDVFGPLGPPSPSPSPSGGRRQAIAEPAPVKLRPADLKIVLAG